MANEIEWLLRAILNDETIQNFTPRSRMEEYLHAALSNAGTEGLSIPRSRIDALLYEFAQEGVGGDSLPTQEKTVTPTLEAQSITADSGYRLAKVNVEPAEEVYKAGKTQEWSDFWDSFQDYGNRTRYNGTFDKCPESAFKPKYDIQPSHAASLFEWSPITNLKQLIKDRGIVLDFSKCSNMANAFANSSITHIPTINTTNANGITSVFSGATMLVEIEKLILKENGSQTINNTFNNAESLESIVIEGTIGANIQLQWSTKLTHDSLMSIINHLKDYSSDANGTIHLLKIGTTNIAKLTDNELEIIISKGWTYE